MIAAIKVDPFVLPEPFSKHDPSTRTSGGGPEPSSSGWDVHEAAQASIRQPEEHRS